MIAEYYSARVSDSRDRGRTFGDYPTDFIAWNAMHKLIRRQGEPIDLPTAILTCVFPTPVPGGGRRIPRPEGFTAVTVAGISYVGLDTLDAGPDGKVDPETTPAMHRIAIVRGEELVSLVTRTLWLHDDADDPIVADNE
jgi:hypothetical protein